MTTSRIYQNPKQPGFYELRSPSGEVVDQGEDKCAEFCCRARELGVNAVVEEVQHPTKPGTPFGFHYTVIERP